MNTRNLVCFFAACIALVGFRDAEGDDGQTTGFRLRSVPIHRVRKVVAVKGESVLGWVESTQGAFAYASFDFSTAPVEKRASLLDQVRIYQQKPDATILILSDFQAKKKGAHVYQAQANSTVKALEASGMTQSELNAPPSPFSSIFLERIPGDGTMLRLHFVHDRRHVTEFSVEVAFGPAAGRGHVFVEAGRFPANSDAARLGMIDIFGPLVTPNTWYTARMRAINVAVSGTSLSPLADQRTWIGGASFQAIMLGEADSSVPRLNAQFRWRAGTLNTASPMGPYIAWQDEHPLTGRLFRLEMSVYDQPNVPPSGGFLLLESQNGTWAPLDRGSWFEIPTNEPRSNALRLISTLATPTRRPDVTFYWDADPTGSGMWNAQAMLIEIVEIPTSQSISKLVSLELQP